MASHRRRRKLGRQCAWCARQLMTDDPIKTAVHETDVAGVYAMFFWHAVCRTAQLADSGVQP